MNVRYDGLDFEVPIGTFEPLEYMVPTMRLAAEVEPRTVIDVGCGVGTQGISVGVRTGAKVLGVDRSEKAVRAARENARAHGVPGHWVTGNLFDPINTRADIIINTLPYETPESYADMTPDHQPPDTYIGDGSFGAVLYYGRFYSHLMAVYGLPGFEEAFELAGWEVEEAVDADDARHFLLSRG